MKKKDYNEIILQNILQHGDIGIHAIDNNKKTIVYNGAMSKLEGLKEETVINRDLLEIFPSLDEESSTLINVMRTGQSIINRTQTYLNLKGQKIVTVNSTLPLIHKGKIVGALEIAKNVTHIKKLSDQLIDLQNELNTNNKEKQNKTIKKYKFKDIIGNNKKLKKAIEVGRRGSKSTSSVLIYGETGSGKELFAQSIHYDGPRKNKPFIAQNCAAIPDSLLEGILFGTEKGGFTGAVDRPGIFEQANGGTLMLDEINSMTLSLQAKLLRVLQEGYIRRVGGIKDIPIDVKIIATTNEDPVESVKKGALRKDLYYRLNVIYIAIPPLKERLDDIPILCEHFIKKYNKELDKDIWLVSEEVLSCFQNYSWPGNVRELENAIESAMNYISEDEHVLKKEHFISNRHIIDSKPKTNLFKKIDEGKALPELIEDIEKKIIIQGLTKNNNNISHTARELGIKRQTLQHKLKKYDIS
ncbi:sigma 54-interacting transcriptional regulator [Anaerosalibacter bizertensis]|uniref:Sigma 54-interacting transcriptional regulator n=1 Tax=Anaerosalibacter bizertensis TaxID=932217 RepID=A0A9Q4ABX8_9FIRM|nr:sigma 54-interacting transcriptional regulator [Anaerosalibacter bizertensis]MBV1817817.1 sigma 54-interacting transcriptional regulator [Bacteroidales bacterium MSK.15.36]MCG4564527.1 sigma 54-interacting transcriptional regulator [Anaerosalibacter bizertensis]MCG4581417.1 sigma 54-interacting transcriptional regulator [Anaerosalibacter bizertensis]